MSNKQPIESLLKKYEQGRCTEEELAIIEEWYRSLNAGKPKTNIDETTVQQLKEESWEHIASVIGNEEKQKKNKSFFFYFSRVAAAVVIGITSFLGYHYYTVKIKTEEYITLKTAKGEFVHIILPDSSAVWVSGGSFLKYPQSFNRSRDIFLENGEAYFEVKHDDKAPFIVHTTSGISTRVLGTKFSVKSFAALADARVKVVSGKVKVQDAAGTYGILTKNQQIRIDKISKAFTIGTVDSSDITGLKQGKIVLNDVPLEELALSLENSFTVPVIISSGKLAHCRISISYTLKDTLENILNDVSLIYAIKIQRNEKGIAITGKGCLEKNYCSL
jgi:ferric-dicitrate binding protein FerR (iron transport regulator)